MGFRDPVVPVALATLGPVMFLKGLLVLAAFEQTGVPGVTETAALAHTRESGRHPRVIAMAIIARGGSGIPAFQQGAAMDTVAIL